MRQRRGGYQELREEDSGRGRLAAQVSDAALASFEEAGRRLRAALEEWRKDAARNSDFLLPLDEVDEAVLSAVKAYSETHRRVVDHPVTRTGEAEALRWDITETTSVIAARSRYVSMTEEELAQLIERQRGSARARFLQELLERKRRHPAAA